MSYSEKEIKHFTDEFKPQGYSIVFDLETLLEIHFQVSFLVNQSVMNEESPLHKIDYEHGSGIVWGIASEWSKEFHELHKETEWGGEYLETLEAFVYEKINNLT